MVRLSGTLMRVSTATAAVAAETLSRAFQADPFFEYFIPDAAQRAANLHHVMRTIVRYSVAAGEACAASPAHEGVAVWLPSEKVNMSLWSGIRHGGLAAPVHLGLSSARRQLHASRAMYAVHERLLHASHWYLYLLGVDPRLQGKGLATPLMMSMLGELDKRRILCYLDNTNERNIPMYEHYGFKVLEEYKIPQTDVRIWAMARTPS